MIDPINEREVLRILDEAFGRAPLEPKAAVPRPPPRPFPSKALTEKAEAPLVPW